MKIDRDIPLPASRQEHKYPFTRLEVGESFLAEGRSVSAITALARYYTKKLGFKYTCRSLPEGIRVWRTK